MTNMLGEAMVRAVMAGRVKAIAAETGIARRRLYRIIDGTARMKFSEMVRIGHACRRFDHGGECLYPDRDR